ncbi:MAG: hypothetical protein WBP43_09295 [Chitinophagales bacterium]
MVDPNIVFPILELTDWVFEGECVYELETKWGGPFYIKENELEKHLQRLIIDSEGKILKVTFEKIISRETTIFSFFMPTKILMELNLELTDRKMTLDEVKRKIISNTEKNFIIKRYKEISEADFNNKLRAAPNFVKLFEIASMEDE